MPPPAAPAFFVITTRGQLGPFNRSGLREALQAGEISAGDQVRTPFGSQLGTVQRVLGRASDRTQQVGEAPELPPVARGGAGPWLVGGGIAVAAVAVGLLLMRGQAPEPLPSTVPVVVADVPIQPAPPTVVEKPATVPVAPPASKQPSPPAKAASAPAQSKPSSKPTKPATSSRKLDPFSDLQPGRTQKGWDRGDGVSAADASPGWRLHFKGSGKWAGITTFTGLDDWSKGEGLAITLGAASAQRRMTFEILEASGERFVAVFRLPAGGKGEVRIPWKDFTRRTELQGKGVADDGLQLTSMKYMALWPEDDGDLTIVITGIALYR